MLLTLLLQLPAVAGRCCCWIIPGLQNDLLSHRLLGAVQGTPANVTAAKAVCPLHLFDRLQAQRCSSLLLSYRTPTLHVST
jgi:hypothetical protein